MPRKWILKVESGLDKQSSYTVHLGLEDPKSAQFVELVAPCRSVEAFQQELDRLAKELQQLAADARGKVEALGQSSTKGAELNPAEIWKQMEGLAAEVEMFELFNALEEQQRQQVAEYIFSNVNMFKGRGPIFSEHYDSTCHILE